MADVQAPAVAASRYTEIASAVAAYLDAAKSTAADGLTWAEFGQLLMALLRLAVRLADLLHVSGVERKELVMEAAGALFDAVADKCISFSMWPLWAFVRTPTKALVLALASGAVEVLLPLVRSSAT